MATMAVITATMHDNQLNSTTTNTPYAGRNSKHYMRTPMLVPPDGVYARCTSGIDKQSQRPGSRILSPGTQLLVAHCQPRLASPR